MSALMSHSNFCLISPLICAKTVQSSLCPLLRGLLSSVLVLFPCIHLDFVSLIQQLCSSLTGKCLKWTHFILKGLLKCAHCFSSHTCCFVSSSCIAFSLYNVFNRFIFSQCSVLLSFVKSTTLLPVHLSLTVIHWMLPGTLLSCKHAGKTLEQADNQCPVTAYPDRQS